MVFNSISSGSCGNVFTVELSDKVVLLEAGLPYKKILKALDFKLPDVVCVSHSHLDHALSVKAFADKGVPVVSNEYTLFAKGIGDWQRDEVHENIILLDAVHDVPNSMFVIDEPSTGDRLFFATDTESIPHTVKGITHLVIEANWSMHTTDDDCMHVDRSKQTHLSLEEALEWIEQQDTSKLKEIHLIHLSDSNSHEEFFEREVAAKFGVPVYVH